MKRGSKYLPMIQSVFRAEGLPLDLAYVPLIESAFKPNALSRAKAKGVWQFMSGTALENGLRHDWYIDERSDPEKATVAAAKYLRTLQQDVRRRLAPGARLLQRRPGPHAARHEARQAGRLLEAGGEAQAAAARDARVRADDPGGHRDRAESGAVRLRLRARDAGRRIETVTLPGPVDLRRVAEWTDTTIDEIQALNPSCAAGRRRSRTRSTS